MTSNILKTLTAATIRILQPLVRILIRNGMSYVTFSNIAKWVYVNTAEKEFGLEGRSPSKSRISVITGLSRKEVKKVKETTWPMESSSAEKYNRAARVIAAWRREKDFADPDGNPLILPVIGDGRTFAELVRKFSGDIPFRAVLDELINAGAVERTEDNDVRLLSRAYITRNDDIMHLHILGTDVGRLVATIDHNMQSGASNRFFQRKVSYDNLPREILPVFQAMAAGSAQKLLEDLDRWLAENDRDINPDAEGTGRYCTGLGIYYFEEPIDTEDG